MLRTKNIHFIAVSLILIALVLIETSADSRKIPELHSNKERPILQEIQIGENLSDFIPFSDGSFVGINQEAIYILEDGNNQEKGSTLLYAIYQYATPNPRKQLLCELPESDYYFLGEMQEDKIYIAPVNVWDGQFIFSVEEISTLGQRNIIYPETSAEKSPIITLVSGGVAVNFESSEFCDLKVVDLKTKEVKFHKKTNIQKSQEKVSGDYLLFCGSTDKELIFYETLKLQNETIEEGKISEMHLYDFSNQIDTVIGLPEKKSLFISGDRELLITSEYEYDLSGKPTGKIYWNSDFRNYTSIPSISPGYDIIYAFAMSNNNLLIANTRELFIIDKSSKEIFSYPNPLFKNIQIRNSSMRKYKSNLYYLQHYNGQVFLKQISFNNTKEQPY